MNATILEQLEKVAKLYRRDFITANEAKELINKTVKEHFEKIGNYEDFIKFVLN